MKKSIELLEAGFESSTGKTPEFMNFVKVFKKEFAREMSTLGIKDIKFNVGHFYISGFFTTSQFSGGQIFYFSLPDVRQYQYAKKNNPDSIWCKMMYRTAKDYKDYTGGVNRHVDIKPLMADEMCWYFKRV
jgi:hypothetical protein